MLVSFERTLFYLMVIAITKTVSFDHYNRNQKYRSGDHRANHEQPFYKDTRHKRVPICRSSAHLFPHGMGVSPPSRLGEGSLASPGDAERIKEVVHIPCPKRMSSNSRSVAALRGQQEFSASELTEHDQVFTGAKDSRRVQEIYPSLKANQNPSQPTDLNQAVKQNQQWLISNQGGAQPQSAQNYNAHDSPTNQAEYTSDQQNRPTTNINQQQAMPDRYYMGQGSPNYVVPPIGRPAETFKGSQKQVNVNKNEQPSPQQNVDNRRVKIKFEGNQANSDAQTHQMAVSNGQYLSPQILKSQDAGPNIGVNQLPPRAYDTKNPPALPAPRNEIVLPGVQESYRHLANAYNMTYEVPRNIFHTMDSPNQLPPYSNSSYNELIPVNQHALFPHNLPNNTNRGNNYGFKQSSATMTNLPPLNYGYNSAREQGTNQQHNTCKHGNKQKGEMDVHNAANVNDNQPQSQGQLETDAGSHLDIHGIHHQQYQESQNVKSGVEHWKEFINPQSEFPHEQSQRNTLTVSSQLGNKDKTGNQVNVEKPAHGLAAIKGFFGKHNREDVKGRQSAGSIDPKPPKSKGHNENLLPPVKNAPTGTDEIVDKACVGKNERALINGKSGVIVVVEKANGIDIGKNNGFSRTQNNSMVKNRQYYNPMDVADASKGHHDTPASIGAPPQQQIIENMNLPTYIQDYKAAEIVPQKKQGNVSRSMSHILSPPVTVEPHLFTNKGLEVVSKVPFSQEATYHSFMGFVPARNDEAFYDKKNMNFLGPIDHPPLINLKRNKAGKTEKRVKTVNKHFKRVSGKYRDEFYNEPADFHSDMTAEDFPQRGKGSKRARYARKCHQNHKTFWQHIKGQDKRGLHRSKVSSYASGP